jgi:nicotinate-nucleotide adenylyltransferase
MKILEGEDTLLYKESEGQDSIPMDQWQTLPEAKQRQLLAMLAQGFHYMPKLSDSLAPTDFGLPDLILKSEVVDEVTFYGGTFEPWHEGHLACLELCPCDHIVVVPDINPWKKVSSLEFGPWSKFLELAQLLARTKYSIYPGFLSLTVGNPTASWLPRVKVEKKNLLMGEDSFLSLLDWKDADLLLGNLNKVYVVPRKKDLLEVRQMVERVSELFPGLTIIQLEHHDYEEVSSTKLRNKK